MRFGLLTQAAKIVLVVMACIATSSGTAWAMPLPLSSAAQVRKMKATIAKDALLKRALGSKCKGKLRMARSSACDFDRDGLINLRERRIGTDWQLKDTDRDFLSDRAELIRFLTDPTKADTDDNGVPDGDEDADHDGIKNEDEDDKPGAAPSAEDLDDSNSQQCAPPNFDADGNTAQFGIPTAITGNITAGQAKYAQRCDACHRGLDKGANYPFANLKSAINGAPMFIRDLSDQEISDLVAYLNRTQTGGTGECHTPAPTPVPTIAGPTQTPMPTPTPTPLGYTCTCSGANFDSACSTQSFGIPSPLRGNIDAGASYFAISCSGCHGLRGSGFTYPQLQASVTGPLMRITNVTNQQYADMVAYLNSTSVTRNCVGPTPSPTPTLSPAQLGRSIFISSCATSGCHTFNSQGRPREMDLHPSRGSIHQALRNGPDEMPQFLSLTLGASAPPYSASEEALYQYLLTIN